MDNVNMEVTNRTKKYVDKTDVKKLKTAMDKQVPTFLSLHLG